MDCRSNDELDRVELVARLFEQVYHALLRALSFIPLLHDLVLELGLDVGHGTEDLLFLSLSEAFLLG